MIKVSSAHLLTSPNKNNVLHQANPWNNSTWTPHTSHEICMVGNMNKDYEGWQCLLAANSGSEAVTVTRNTSLNCIKSMEAWLEKPKKLRGILIR